VCNGPTLAPYAPSGALSPLLRLPRGGGDFSAGRFEPIRRAPYNIYFFEEEVALNRCEYAAPMEARGWAGEVVVG
jgi:hypothetical protein